ncbi:MAG: hypothetical protein HRU15_11735, partial [Planctomycetes bacterium]|nr:hypothetical protein [Planctomycetota bacterium]
IPELGAIPCLGSVKFKEEEIRVGRPMGMFGQVTFDLMDFIDDDRNEDPFFSDVSRNGIDGSAGTYLTKLRVRNPYWTGRAVRVIEGWATDGVWHPDDVIEHVYFIRDVQGVTNKRLTITAAGPLQLLNLNEKEMPAPSSGALLFNINAAETVVAFDTLDNATPYPTFGFVRIGDEYCAFSRLGVDLTLLRAQGKTTAADHSAGDMIQLCAVYDDWPITDIIIDALQTYGGVDPIYIDTDEFASEQIEYLNLYIVSGIISKPEKILDVVRELLEAAAALLFWDDQRGKIRLKALRPVIDTSGIWTDRLHLLSAPKRGQDMKERVSRADVYMDLRTATSDPKKLTNYRKRLIGTSQGAEADEHESEKLRDKPLTTRWLTSNQIALAVRASNQIVDQLKDGRKTLICEVGAKDAGREIGDIIDVKTRDIINIQGAIDIRRYVIEKREVIKIGSTYRYTLEEVPFGIGGRFIFLCAVGLPDYNAATPEQRDPGWFLAPSNGGPFDAQNPAFVLS